MIVVIMFGIGGGRGRRRGVNGSKTGWKEVLDGWAGRKFRTDGRGDIGAALAIVPFWGGNVASSCIFRCVSNTQTDAAGFSDSH